MVEGCGGSVWGGLWGVEVVVVVDVGSVYDDCAVAVTVAVDDLVWY